MGEKLEIDWPLIGFTQRVSHKIFDGVQRTYTYHWVGNLVTGVEPQGEWLPLYDGGWREADTGPRG